jgi:polar amino acid transport system substrate-binding protein
MLNGENVKKAVMALIVALMPCLTAFAAAKPYEVSLRADYWYPYNGEPNSIKPGYMIEIAAKAFSEAGLGMDYRLMPWQQAIKSANAGNIDCLVGPTKEEAPELIFPKNSLGIAQTGFYSRFGELSGWRYQGVESFKGLRIGVTASVIYIEDDEVIAYLADADNDIYIASSDKPLIELMGALAKGDLDMVIETSSVFKAVSRQQGVFLLFTEVDKHPYENHIYIACSKNVKNAQQYVDMLDRTLIKMRSDGSLENLLRNYGIRDWQK